MVDSRFPSHLVPTELSKQAKERNRTYIYSRYALELFVIVNELGSMKHERLLNASARDILNVRLLHHLLHGELHWLHHLQLGHIGFVNFWPLLFQKLRRRVIILSNNVNTTSLQCLALLVGSRHGTC